ncbi:hypothetical protein GCM10027075_57400 [Streptomyces heilongjiangensis]
MRELRLTMAFRSAANGIPVRRPLEPGYAACGILPRPRHTAGQGTPTNIRQRMDTRSGLVKNGVIGI